MTDKTGILTENRMQVAALSGSEWCQWLGKTGGEAASETCSRRLEYGVFQDSELTAELVEYAARWINRHGDTT